MPTSKHQTPWCVVAVSAAIFMTSTSFYVDAHDTDEPLQRAEQLGSVQFPTSCNPNADAQFQRAVAMLHSFWCPETEAKAVLSASNTTVQSQ